MFKIKGFNQMNCHLPEERSFGNLLMPELLFHFV